MSSWKVLSSAEQVYMHLREGLLEGRWSGSMPGINKLSSELHVNRHAIESALIQLEKEGLLIPQGVGRRRQIKIPKNSITLPGLSVGFLLYEPADSYAYETVELRHQLLEAGHRIISLPKTLMELKMNLEKVSQLVNKTKADAWIVFAADRDILEWFSKQPTPTIAYAGQRSPDLQIGCVAPDKRMVIKSLARNLISLGHRRIVWLARSSRPVPFFEEMEAHGIPVGPYNKPTWELNATGFQNCLDSLFSITPPTALVIDEAPLFLAAVNYLARRGILAPEHVSLVCTDPDPVFDWYNPSVAHISWDRSELVRYIVEWIAKISRGEEDLRMVYTKSSFQDGGTVGRVPSS
jgi:DNA-binding LacI/PurR family transcriptional regulator